MTDPMTRTEAEPLSASEALRRLIEFADDYEAIARAAHVWDKDGAPETIVRRIQQYRSVAARSNSSEDEEPMYPEVGPTAARRAIKGRWSALSVSREAEPRREYVEDADYDVFVPQETER